MSRLRRSIAIAQPIRSRAPARRFAAWGAALTRPDAQAGDRGRRAAERGQHQDGPFIALRPQRHEQHHPGHARQVQVEDDHRRIAAARDAARNPAR
jgi:hypothetical protein